MKKEILKKIVTHIFSIAATVFFTTIISIIIITFMVNHSMNKKFEKYKKQKIEQLKEEANEFNEKITDNNEKTEENKKRDEINSEELIKITKVVQHYFRNVITENPVLEVAGQKLFLKSKSVENSSDKMFGKNSDYLGLFERNNGKELFVSYSEKDDSEDEIKFSQETQKIITYFSLIDEEKGKMVSFFPDKKSLIIYDINFKDLVERRKTNKEIGSLDGDLFERKEVKTIDFKDAKELNKILEEMFAGTYNYNK